MEKRKSHDKGIGTLKSDVQILKSDVKRMDSKLNTIDSTLVGLASAVNMLLSKAGFGKEITISESPIKLSKVGKEISDNVKAEEIIKDQMSRLRPMFESISNSYDIQEKAMELGESIYNEVDDDVKDNIKKEVYRTGLLLLQAFPIFSILLRDAIMEEQGDKGRVVYCLLIAKPHNPVALNH